MVNDLTSFDVDAINFSFKLNFAYFQSLKSEQKVIVIFSYFLQLFLVTFVDLIQMPQKQFKINLVLKQSFQANQFFELKSEFIHLFQLKASLENLCIYVCPFTEAFKINSTNSKRILEPCTLFLRASIEPNKEVTFESDNYFIYF